MLDKNTNANKFKLLPVIYFSKYMHCDMQFLVVKINVFPNVFLNGACIAVPELCYLNIDKLDQCLHCNLTIAWPPKLVL